MYVAALCVNGGVKKSFTYVCVYVLFGLFNNVAPPNDINEVIGTNMIVHKET